MQDREHTIPVGGQSVSARLQCPEGARCLLVLGHGAGSNREHATMGAVADALLTRKLAVLRYNFPYSERRSRRIDARPLILSTIETVIAEGTRALPELALFAGGHSFGGRMTSTLQARRPVPGLKGMVFCSFPLHPAGRPATERADHLNGIETPMLFLSGTRDRLAQAQLLENVCAGLPLATLHWLDTADHGYRVLKRRESTETVFEEIARVTQEWINGILGATS